jgi:hypothetical protein
MLFVFPLLFEGCGKVLFDIMSLFLPLSEWIPPQVSL